ncbi:MAG: hypothetical protein JNL79_08660 [Myxococcales bacterium]|nr:hypothetical protein [Myxococcales bacterium]
MLRPTVRRFSCLLALALAPVLGAGFAASTVSTADAAPPAKDPLADAFAGQILFLDQAPPASVSGPGWFSAHKISKKDENSDKKWPLHLMVFLKKPLDTPALNLMVYKIDKKGVVDFVQKVEQFPSTDGRSFYFLVTLRKEPPYEPNLKYQLKAVVTGGGAVAEGTIELTGKEEKPIDGGPMDFTKGVDLGKPKETEKPTQPFDAEATKEALKKVIYEDCKTAGSKGGDAKIVLKFSAKDGKVLSAEFAKDPPAPYSDATQTCVAQRFKKAKTKPFTGDDKTISYKVNL